MIKLRPYEKNDAAVVIGWPEDERTFRMWSADKYERYPIEPDDMNALYDRLEREGLGFRAYTALDEGDTVGHITARYTDTSRTQLHIGFIVVDGARRGQGIGRAMLGLMLELAFGELRAETVDLGVFENNVRAHGLYASVGFSDLPEPPKEFMLMGEKWRCIKMEITAETYRKKNSAKDTARA